MDARALASVLSDSICSTRIMFDSDQQQNLPEPPSFPDTKSFGNISPNSATVKAETFDLNLELPFDRLVVHSKLHLPSSLTQDHRLLCGTPNCFNFLDHSSEVTWLDSFIGYSSSNTK